MKSKHLLYKRMFYTVLVFSSLSLFSAGFASFNIVSGNANIDGSINVAPVISINLTTNYNGGIMTFNYNEHGFQASNVFNGVTYDSYSNTNPAQIDLYFNMVSSSEINVSANFNVILTQNSAESFSFFDSTNVETTAYYGTSSNNYPNSITNLSNSLNGNSLNLSISNFNYSLKRNVPIYFKVSHKFTLSNADNYNSAYNWLESFGSTTSPFTLNVTAIVSENGGN